MAKGHWALAASCAFEAATGLALIMAPALLGQLVLGAAVEDSAILIAKIAGLALICLAIACWPYSGGAPRSAYVALLIYNTIAAMLLINGAVAETATGTLLWPAAITHLAFAVLFAIALLVIRKPTAT